MKVETVKSTERVAPCQTKPGNCSMHTTCTQTHMKIDNLVTSFELAEFSSWGHVRTS